MNAGEVLAAHVRVSGDGTFATPPTTRWTLLSQNVEPNMNYKTGLFHKDTVGDEHGMTVNFRSLVRLRSSRRASVKPERR